MSTRKLQPEAEAIVNAAGWDRHKRDDGLVHKWELSLPEFRIFDVAKDALAIYGGIKVTGTGPGLEARKVPFHMDPTLASGENDRFTAFEPFVGELYPLGEADTGRFFLAIAKDGQVYMLAQDIMRAGLDIVDALERLTLGKKLDWIPA